MQTRVLVIGEDTEIIKQILEPNGFEVFEAESSPEGIRAANYHQPEVIVLDLLSPPQDGLQICKNLRAVSEIPILVLAATNAPEVVARMLDEGADDYLLKSTPSSVLVAHLKRLARRAWAENAAHKRKRELH
jgi:DNA-binding response OmpR family regulator